MAESSGTESIFAAATFLLFGAATIKLLAFTRVPYSVLLLGLDPGFLFLLLAPPVLFHAAGSLPKARLSHSACHIILLGIVGVGTGAAMTAVHASEELTTVIDGEALVDDGVAAVLYAIFLKSVQGSPESASGYVKLAFQLSAGGPAVGMAFALCLSAWLKLAGGNLFADLGMTLVAAYGSFHVADILGCSNILATVTLGMSMALFGWSMLHKDLQDPVTVCWEVIEYFANTLIFVISGVIIAGRIYAGHQAGSPHILTGIDYAWAVALWLLLLVVRVINIILFWPILARTGPGLDLPSAAATAWSGIRGFVGLILALMVSVDTDIQDEPYKLLCLFFMATTACLTIILQGGIFELVLWGLGLVKPALPETNVQQGQQTSSLAAATA
ncbi:MAG: Na+ H+ antiporter [Trebouxia sp. A1-2]|nr:MAG: Na+ H+ antiporter [Trebouxia sp. A1-2]